MKGLPKPTTAASDDLVRAALPAIQALVKAKGKTITFTTANSLTTTASNGIPLFAKVAVSLGALLLVSLGATLLILRRRSQHSERAAQHDGERDGTADESK